MNFAEFFSQATQEGAPFPYQGRIADAPELPELIHAPTGAGKTATAVLGWAWRYFHTSHPTPRRLVYCLPMRVLVEQTRDEAQRWMMNAELDQHVKVHVLMGGEASEDWDLSPETPAILIGTQDMLLSRALNRGYGMGRFRWPMHFGLLNNDCLWVLDEIQLMGTGLATSTQLQAFRESLGTHGAVKTVWMSATLLPRWLESIDFRSRVPALCSEKLNAADYRADGLRERWMATKPIRQAALVEAVASGDKKETIINANSTNVAKFVANVHVASSLTLVIVNTVERARALYQALSRLYFPKTNAKRKATATEQAPTIDLKLIHSRFRPVERAAWWSWLKQDAQSLQTEHPDGRIVIATQVVEAGVDLSARTLITELAPWPSLVQRFGRCNRRGEFLKHNQAQVFWLDVPSPDDTKAAPYSKNELDAARQHIRPFRDVGLQSLSEFFEQLPESQREELFPFDPQHVIRRKDFIDLFDTTSDLSGNDIDVARFIRDGDEIDVQVFWRSEIPNHKWPKKEMRRQAPRREELCTVSFVRFRDDFLRKDKVAFRWDSVDGRWSRVTKINADSVYPGQVFWIQASQGGYDKDLGWDPKVDSVEADLLIPLPHMEISPKPEAAFDDDDESRYELGWQTVADHTQEVIETLVSLLKTLPLSDQFRSALIAAARWHDWGKAHEVFQAAIEKPTDWVIGTYLAKAPDGSWKTYSRKHFRHELASALGVLTLLKASNAPEQWTHLDPLLQNLALYLIAAHHGKVRLSIRSMPEELIPSNPNALFARGVWEGDALPTVDLGGGVTAPMIQCLDLAPMRLGRTDGILSWAERMLGLRDHPNLGPLRLCYLETLLRAADIRASKAADKKAKGVKP